MVKKAMCIRGSDGKIKHEKYFGCQEGLRAIKIHDAHKLDQRSRMPMIL
jgi:hypothetical protein